MESEREREREREKKRGREREEERGREGERERGRERERDRSKRRKREKARANLSTGATRQRNKTRLSAAPLFSSIHGRWSISRNHWSMNASLLVLASAKIFVHCKIGELFSLG